ncbi:annexin A13-like [Pollicipes pollicipes]|uniref:annexin A13-like n=1 Tax=Pollicipes pollicipes TaxID=41117 RepID=UPI001884BCDA|nr:annexin A13-like [Pollicipes pollicipes]
MSMQEMPARGGKRKVKGHAQARPVISAPRGTIKPHKNFDEEEATSQAKKLRRALRKPVDMATVIGILTKYTLEERKYLSDVYNAQYGGCLLDAVQSESNFSLRETLLALLQWQNQYLADWAHRAMKGLGTNEKALIELFCGRTQAEIQDVVKTYHRLHGRSLEAALRSELSGDFLRLFLGLTQLERQQDAVVGDNRARELAEELYAAGEARRGKDADVFVRIFCTTDYALLRKVFAVYPEVSARGSSIEKAIRSEFGGDMKAGLLTMAQCITDQPSYFAEKLYRAMRGLGTDDSTLIRILVTRSEIDLENIKEAYQLRYGKSLAAAVADDTSGEYKKCLLAIIKSWT